MKRVMHGKREDNFSGMPCPFKDRRKGYYPGKYNRQVSLLLLFVVCIGILVIY
ncbi:MAG: hypothetical protein ACI8R9_001003 [Paraglaciecola sp.]|jgi:hypothetical protein